MNFVEHLRERGLIQDLSDPALASKLKKGDAFYVGFDPTSPHLHIGNLIQIIVAIHLAKIGGLRPILLFGGATGAIGDPSGKSAERQLLDRETIDRNVASHLALVRSIVGQFDVQIEFVNNFDWTAPISVLDFLRDIGKHFTVNYMIAKEVVKTRLNNEGMSYTEFSYMLLQANDFLHLYQNHGCKLQIGGSDQWGNITAGLELIRRKLQQEAFALSIPLLLDQEGNKFGKSAKGAPWIDRAGMSPYHFHQFWLNAEDAMVPSLLRIFTFLDLTTIAEAEAALRAAPEKREAQRLLADEVCTLVHGKQATDEAKRSAEVLFGGSIEGISDQTLLDIFREVPSSSIQRGSLADLNVVDLLVQAKLTPSKGEARRLIQSGGAYINNRRVGEANAKAADFAEPNRGVMVLRSGKKNYHLVQVAG